MPRARSIGLLFVGGRQRVGGLQHRHPARPVGGAGGPGRVRRHVRPAGVLRRAGDQDVAAAAGGQRAGPGRGERRQEASTAARNGSRSRTTFSSSTCAGSSTRTGAGCPSRSRPRTRSRSRSSGRRRPGAKRVITDQDAEMAHRRRDLQPAVPRLPVRAALRRAAVSPAAGHVGSAAARGPQARPPQTVARRAGWRHRRRRAGPTRRRRSRALRRGCARDGRESPRPRLARSGNAKRSAIGEQPRSEEDVEQRGARQERTERDLGVAQRFVGSAAAAAARRATARSGR